MPTRPRASGQGETSWARRRTHQGRRAGARTGFTLLEVSLVIVLMLLLGAVVIVSMEGAMRQTQVDESVWRMESLVRTVRAQAAISGRRFRLRFEGDTAQPVVLIERDGLNQPNVFEPYQEWWTRQAQLEQGARVVGCELLGASSPVEVEVGSDSEKQLPSITFCPDGGCDSARIVMAATRQDKVRYYEITVNGVDGTIRSRPMEPEELEAKAE